MVLEKTLESSLDCKEIQPVHSEGDQPWDFFGRTDAKAENSSTLAWKIPWTEEPGGLQSMGSLGIGHDFTFTSLFNMLSGWT